MKTYKKSFEVNDYHYIFRSQIPDKALFDGCFNDSFFKKNEYNIFENEKNINKDNNNDINNNKFFERSNTNYTNNTNDTFNFNTNTMTNGSININNTNYINQDKNNYSLFTQKKILGEDIVSPISKTEMGKKMT